MLRSPKVVNEEFEPNCNLEVHAFVVLAITQSARKWESCLLATNKVFFAYCIVFKETLGSRNDSEFSSKKHVKAYCRLAKYIDC